MYAHYFNMVKSAPGATGVAPYFSSTIKPMLEGEDMEAMMAAYNADQDAHE